MQQLQRKKYMISIIAGAQRCPAGSSLPCAAALKARMCFIKKNV